MQKKCRGRIAVEVLGSLLLGVALFTTILAHTPALAQLSSYNPQGLRATTLEEVLALPDEEIDLATAIMILYKEWDASFDVAGSLEEIDRMALELEARISPEDNPERVVSLINQYLFEENTYSGADPSDPGYMRKLEYSALPSVIENKKGNCLGLSLLYLALAERLGLPFYGVAAPEHVFVRYDDGKKAINVETTQEGKEYKDSHYEKVFMLHPTYRDYNIYLRNLLKRELIGSFLNDLGLCYYEKGMHDEAIPQYKNALAISPNFVEAHYNLGLVYGRKEMHSEAICECKKAIEINPNDAKAHYNLGVVYHGSGMYDKAIGELKKALAIKPYYAEAHTNLGAAYGGKGMYDKAIAELKKALAINPRDVEAHYNLGLCYRRKGMYDEAIAELKEALEINPGHAEVLYGLGVVYGHKGMVDKAIAEYKKALEVNPNYADAHYNLGVAYAGKGMLDKAIAEYRKVLDINPDCAEAHNNLAVVYYFNGQYSLAIEHCDKVIELGYRVHPEFLEDLEPYREK